MVMTLTSRSDATDDENTLLYVTVYKSGGNGCNNYCLGLGCHGNDDAEVSLILVRPDLLNDLIMFNVVVKFQSE